MRIENACCNCERITKPVIEPGVLARSGDTITFWIEPNNGLNNTTSQQTAELIRKGFAEISAACLLTFEERGRRNEAGIKIAFAGNDSRLRVSGGGYALGRAHGDGRIFLNAERNVGTFETITRTRLIESLLQHEFFHVQDWRHVPLERTDRIMHPHLTARYFHPEDVRQMWRRFGRNETFRPATLIELGRRIRENISTAEELLDTWNRLIANARANGNRRTNLYGDITDDSAQWHALSELWTSEGII